MSDTDMAHDEPDRYDPDETAEVLATALILVQSYGHNLFGMSPSMWVDDAVAFRKRVNAATGVIYDAAVA